MRTLASPLAMLLLGGLSALAVAGVAGAWRWARWVGTVGGAVGIAGLLATAIALVNLVVPRTCARTSLPGGTELRDVNRPVISLVLDGGDCFESALGQAQLAVLAGLATSTLTLRRTMARRSVPVVPPQTPS